MSMRPLFPFLALLAGCGLAHAQSVPSAPPAASDSWSRPASSATTGQAAYGNGAQGAAKRDAGNGSHFKFKDRDSYQPQRNAALEASGKAGVGGGTSMDRNGRPTVNCAQTPMDPACH